MTPAEAMAQARARLVAAGISEADAALDAEVLARHVLGWDRARLVAHMREAAPDSFPPAYDTVIARRIRREPVAYIVGSREFYDLEFEVTPDVLIPRPETELIVEEALRLHSERPLRRIADVGTGSGCLAVTLATHVGHASVAATDTSPQALAVAARNAVRHRVQDRVSFVQTNLLDGVAETFDLIVCNPPYVPEADRTSMQPEVVQFEPHSALFAGHDGMAAIALLLRDLRSHLAPDGHLIIEFGIGQEDSVRRLAAQNGWQVVRVRADLQSIPRTAVLNLGVRS